MTRLAPLHPETQQLQRQCPQPRERLEAIWRAHVPNARHLRGIFLGEVPLVASALLVERLNDRIQSALKALGPWLTPAEEEAWPCAVPADVLALDLAVVSCDEEPGWDLRWVEIQAFTSVLATLVLLRRGHQACWPQLAGRGPHVQGLRAAIGGHAAPEPSVLLEYDPWSQRSSFDLEAASRLWGLPVVEPDRLRRRGNRLEAWLEGSWRPVDHVFNRLIPHQHPDRESVCRLLAGAQARWHSHPRWFYRIDKGLLPYLDLPASERCLPATRWRELALPAEALVAKARHSWGGRDVRTHVDAQTLDGLPMPADWVVQPRFYPQPLAKARDGAPLFGEIRCMMALPLTGEPWLMGRIVRLTRGATMSSVTGAPGEGVSLLYDPPQGG
jgi:hypothetical protein